MTEFGSNLKCQTFDSCPAKKKKIEEKNQFMDKKQKLRMRSVAMNSNELFDVLSQLQADPRIVDRQPLSI